ncbi:alpha/beta hydrolases superfamily protein [Tanacetum coccineum]|uniref:Alpha/beta hydrolases superfamily protein n=1 Tax=Tanacetum coccineum TaxID=301880 RepID=A0ABQ5BKE8_9ASTR
MAGGGASRKISAASARSHTRSSKSKSKSSLFHKGILKKFLIVFFMGFLAWAYQATRPPPPKICGSPDGPPVTSPRIKLRDGRHLSYLEYGVPKETAQYKIIYVHGFDNCKHHNLFAFAASPALIEELGVYTVSFDRPGYGESDPDPNRTLKSLALDIEELADQLGLGSRFYVVGMSMGGNFVWACLKYIPHRLAGVAFIAPVINYWWPSFPANLSNEAYYYKQFKPDQWSLRVAHHIPWLTYWWNTQKWFPSSSVASQSLDMFSPPDMEVLSKFPGPTEAQKTQPRQQGEYESLHRDLMIGFGKWEFDPMKLENPFPNNEGSIHLWMGDDDRFVPVTLQRYIAQQLPWINYHELTRAGHMFAFADGMTDTILKTLLNVKE